jgi:hypothetical protein
MYVPAPLAGANVHQDNMISAAEEPTPIEARRPRGLPSPVPFTRLVVDTTDWPVR